MIIKKILLSIILFFQLIVEAQDVPNTPLYDLEGKLTNLVEKSKSHEYTIVSFWATWCASCIKEMEAIDEVFQDWQEEFNIQAIAVAVDDSRSQRLVRGISNSKDWIWEVLLDKNQALQRGLNFGAVPYLILLKDNKIIYKKTGYSPGSESHIYEFLKNQEIATKNERNF